MVITRLSVLALKNQYIAPKFHDQTSYLRLIYAAVFDAELKCTASGLRYIQSRVVFNCYKHEHNGRLKPVLQSMVTAALVYIKRKEGDYRTFGSIKAVKVPEQLFGSNLVMTE